MKEHFIYCQSTETIRLMPGNYCLAYRKSVGEFIFSADLGINLCIIQKVMPVVHSYNFRWGNPIETVKRLNLALESGVNENLEAAVLELLDALKTLTDSCFHVNGICRPGKLAFEYALAVITKAEGRAK